MKKKDSKQKKTTTKKSGEKPKIVSSNSTNTEKPKNLYPNDIQGLFERLGLE